MGQVREECGVFGVFDPHGRAAAQDVYYGLYALQHRGQEGCGIVVGGGDGFRLHRRAGLVGEAFSQPCLEELGAGEIALGHVRYATTGDDSIENIQPLLLRLRRGSMAVAHNGNLVGTQELHDRFEARGAVFHTTTDTEVIAYAVNQALLEDPFRPLPEAVAAGLQQLHGAYSLLIAFPDRLIAVRDPHGFRPLCMGRRGDQTVFASESCALDAVGAAFVRDLEPGELISVDAKGPAVHWVTGARPSAVHPGQLCVFEFVYFARADSVIHGCSVQEARLRAGRLLAKEQPRDADVVIGVPDSGLEAAMGYARAAGIPYGFGFVKNRYVGRSFIQPTQDLREQAVRLKLGAVRSAVEGKRVVMIDDSIVRGTTCRHLVDMLREAGAREVHMLVSSPPFRFPCFYGTDVSSGEALIACRLTVEETAREIGADSLGYLSLESVVKIAEQAACGFCTACFSGVYPHEDEQSAQG